MVGGSPEDTTPRRLERDLRGAVLDDVAVKRHAPPVAEIGRGHAHRSGPVHLHLEDGIETQSGRTPKMN